LNRVIVVKIGGSTLGSHDTAIEDIVELQKSGINLVVVHGGGKLITAWLEKQGIQGHFIHGERYTDQPTLEVATAVLSGLVNKDIVASINRLGGKAAGISGVDGALIEGKIADKEKGYVGAVTRVNTAILETLVQEGFIPVIATIGMNSAQGTDDTPKTLNYNSDIVAGEIATAIKAERLIVLTDVTGISDSSGNLLSELTPDEAKTLIASGTASGGMIPKIKACLTALKETAITSIIDGRQPHALLDEIRGKNTGTTIRK
jgi:acetylglutamate kinase